MLSSVWNNKPGIFASLIIHKKSLERSKVWSAILIRKEIVLTIDSASFSVMPDRPGHTASWKVLRLHPDFHINLTEKSADFVFIYIEKKKLLNNRNSDLHFAISQKNCFRWIFDEVFFGKFQLKKPNIVIYRKDCRGWDQLFWNPCLISNFSNFSNLC